MNSRIEVPVCIGEHGELRWYTSVFPKPLFSSVLMPLEQEINKAVLFQGIVSRVFNSIEESAEGLGIGGRPKGIWLSYTPGRKEDVKNE
jgi:hypothetical protein